MNKTETNKVIYGLIIAGSIMIAASGINFWMNEDDISLGIFAFTGLGFIMLGLASKYETKTEKRLKKYAYLMFAMAVLVLIYWFLHGKLELF